MLPVYRFLADRIGRRLGRPVELVVGRSFDQFEQGKADLGVICGLPYVWLADRQPPPVQLLAAPVLAGDGTVASGPKVPPAVAEWSRFPVQTAVGSAQKQSILA